MKLLPFLIPVCLIILGYVLWKFTDEESWLFGGGLIGGIFLIIAFLSLPICRYKAYNFEMEYMAAAQTIQTQRASGIQIESAALTQKIIDINKEIASIKFWNEDIFDWYWPDQVANLKPLE